MTNSRCDIFNLFRKKLYIISVSAIYRLPKIIGSLCAKYILLIAYINMNFVSFHTVKCWLLSAVLLLDSSI